ncbi:MAG: histidine kinase dimerization/phosphoacceptor domain -containing protein [Nitrospirota bacterium]
MEKVKVLVVEDEAIIAKDLQWRLQDMGYDVPYIVASGEDAITRVREDNIDMVLMDIMLQGQMDGIEAAGQIHSERDIPIVFLTAYADDKMLERAKITEPFGYLIKPVRDRELYSTIEMALYKHKTEKRIRESESKYRTLLENLPQKIFYKDRNSVYISCNEKFAKDLKIKPEEIVGKTDADFFHWKLAEKYRDDDQRIVGSGETEDINEEYIRGGEKQIVHTVKTPIKNEGGDVTGILGIFWDVTKIMQTRDELKRYREQLEHMVEERTTELLKTNKQLKQEIVARKEMEEKIRRSLEEREVLLREIHHRVGNNLQVIYGLLDMHSEFTGDSPSSEIFKGCQDRIMSMSLVHKTLFRSKDLTQINFHDYISKLVDRLYKRYELDPARITLRIDAEDVFIGLETAIPCGLIINELVSNSLKHAFPEKRKGELRIGLHVIDRNEYELIISDDGIGLPEGLDFRSAQSLGFRTVASFEKSGPLGEFVLNRTGGTEFRIKFRSDLFAG